MPANLLPIGWAKVPCDLIESVPDRNFAEIRRPGSRKALSSADSQEIDVFPWVPELVENINDSIIGAANPTESQQRQKAGGRPTHEVANQMAPTALTGGADKLASEKLV